MDDLSKIKRSIRRIAGGGSRWCFTAKLKSVDGEVCSVETEGLTLTDVRLRAVVNGEESKMLVTPKTESYVTYALSGWRGLDFRLAGFHFSSFESTKPSLRMLSRKKLTASVPTLIGMVLCIARFSSCALSCIRRLNSSGFIVS